MEQKINCKTRLSKLVIALSLLLGVGSLVTQASALPLAEISQPNKIVKGHVVDETGEPVIGASIIQNGTTKGTVTDLDGNFSLNVNSGASITISYVGYTSQNMKVTSSAPLKITLKEETSHMISIDVIIIFFIVLYCIIILYN